jgi:MFS family permease
MSDIYTQEHYQQIDCRDIHSEQELVKQTPSPHFHSSLVSKYSLSLRNSSLVASILGGGIFGYCTTIIAGLSDGLIQIHFLPHASTSTQSIGVGMLTASVMAGGGVGCFLGLALAARYGFRFTFAITGAICLIFSLLMVVFDDLITLLFLRAFQGLSVGMSAALVPLYVTELPLPPDEQGRLGAVIQLSIAVFIIIAESTARLANPDNSLQISEWNWKGQLAASSLLGLGFLCFAPFLRETPASLAQSSSSTETKLAVASSTESGQTLGISALFRREHRSSLWIALILAGCDQLTGIDVFLLYAPRFLRRAGLSDTLGWSILFVGVVNLLACLVAIALVDRHGRRPLMLGGLSLMTLATFGMSLGYACAGSSAEGPVALAAMIVFFTGFELGPGSLFFLLAAESFPPEIRNAALSVTQAVWWSCSTAVVFLFPLLESVTSSAELFGIFAAINVLFTFLVAIGTKETKIMSIDENRSVIHDTCINTQLSNQQLDSVVNTESGLAAA